jgi:hypothetical protein
MFAGALDRHQITNAPGPMFLARDRVKPMRLEDLRLSDSLYPASNWTSQKLLADDDHGLAVHRHPIAFRALA